MKLLHVVAGNLYGGIETLLATLARHREEASELEQRFAVCFEGRLSRELEAAGVRPTVLGSARASRPWTVWRARRNLEKVLERDRCDVVACHGSWAHAVFGPAAHARRARLVFWAHAPFGDGGWLESWASRTAPDLVIANSQFTVRSSRGALTEWPAEVYYSPVDSANGFSRSVVRDEVRRSLGAGADHVAIMCAARFEPWKGVHVLLEALGLLRESPPWVCWIAGGAQRPDEVDYGRRLGEIATRAGIFDRVSFLGHRLDVARLLRGADVYCQPNTGPEPFGISIVEALYAGLPVVTTAMGGAVEIVDERCGILTEPNAIAVSAVLGRLLRDAALRRRLGEAAVGRAQSLCDPRTQLRTLAALLRRRLS